MLKFKIYKNDGKQFETKINQTFKRAQAEGNGEIELMRRIKIGDTKVSQFAFRTHGKTIALVIAGIDPIECRGTNEIILDCATKPIKNTILIAGADAEKFAPAKRWMRYLEEDMSPWRGALSFKDALGGDDKYYPEVGPGIKTLDDYWCDAPNPPKIIRPIKDIVKSVKLVIEVGNLPYSHLAFISKPCGRRSEETLMRNTIRKVINSRKLTLCNKDLLGFGARRTSRGFYRYYGTKNIIAYAAQKKILNVYIGTPSISWCNGEPQLMDMDNFKNTNFAIITALVSLLKKQK